VDGESSATAGSDAKEGIENHERIESVSTCTTALRDGESGINVLCVDGESSATTVSDAKEGIENHQRTTSASRLDDCLARWRERYAVAR
jgi:hypothetical protein